MLVLPPAPFYLECGHQFRKQVIDGCGYVVPPITMGQLEQAVGLASQTVIHVADCNYPVCERAVVSGMRANPII